MDKPGHGSGVGGARPPRDGSGPRCDCVAAGGWPGFGFRIGLALAFAGQGMVFGLGYNNALAAGEAPAYGTPWYWGTHGALLLSALAVLGLLGGPLLRETWTAVRARRLSVEALFALSGTGALAGSLISSLRGSGSVYYEVVAVVLCVYAIGRQVGAIQKGRVGEALAAFRRAFDEAVVAGPQGQRLRKPVAALSPDDRVLVGPGDPIPVDAVIESGRGYLRETALTGEPAPVSKGSGESALAGTWSVDGHFTLRPRPGRDRAIEPILRMLESAPQSPSRLQEAADRLMRVFIPVVSLVAAGTFAGWLLLGAGSAWDALFNAMAVLLVACPCALGLAMPAGLWAGLYHLSQRGLVGRHGHLLDSLAECTAVVFDKTGTLTEFELGADAAQLGRDDQERARLLHQLASLAGHSRHPVSAALARLRSDWLAVGELEVVPGKGLAGRVAGDRILAGERELLRERGVALPEPTPTAPGKAVHVACNGRYAGAVFLTERLRPEAAPVLQSLEAMGLRCAILSGDPAPAHAAIGGVPVQGGLSPEEKASRVRALAAAGHHVLFIGDGVNDLPAMEASHAALAIDLGAALATEFADGLLVDGRVGPLPSAIRQARRLKRDLTGNLRFALLYNLIGMALAAAGQLHPVVAALLMAGSSAIVSARALRAAARG